MVSCQLYIHPSVFLFLDDNLSKCKWILTKLVICINIMRSGLGLLMGKFRQFLIVIYPINVHIFISGQ